MQLEGGVILAIDPGPSKCGAVLYDADAYTASPFLGGCPSTAELLDHLASEAWEPPALVLVERVQSYGISGASLLQTAEVYGHVAGICRVRGVRFGGAYRKEVCDALMVRGGSRDKQVRERVLEHLGTHHGLAAKAVVGRKATPGPAYGIASHAWQALGLAIAWPVVVVSRAV